MAPIPQSEQQHLDYWGVWQLVPQHSLETEELVGKRFTVNSLCILRRLISVLEAIKYTCIHAIVHTS